MPFCRNCGSQVEEQDRFCNICGASAATGFRAAGPVWVAQPGARPSSLTGVFIGSQVIVLIGCVMLVIGPFLSWMNAHVLEEISASGLQKTDNEALLIVILGVIGAAFAVVSLALKRRTFTWVLFVVGLVSLGLSVYYYVQLRDQLIYPDLGDISTSLGTGIYICLVGSIVVLVGALVAAVSKKSRGA
jgi:hypothetical protein